MTRMRLLVLAAAAAPALMLGACKKGADAGGSGSTAAAKPVPAPPGGWIGQVTRTDAGGYLMGNPNAPVKLIEFGSRTCPHCGHFAEEGVPPLKAKYVATGEVSYEFRDYAIHAPDLAAILTGQCTTPQAYFPLLEQTFANQPAVFEKLNAVPPAFQQQLQGKSAAQQAQAWADYLGYVSFVGQRGVPPAKAQACLTDQKAIDAFAQHMADDTAKYSIDSTPSFVLNGEKQTDVLNWAQLEAKIQAALGQ